MGDGKALRAFMVICGSLEIVLFGGIIFGWASLVYIYKDEGYFSHLCTNHTFGGNISATLPQTNEYSTSTLDPSVRASLSSNLTNGGGRNLDSNHGALSCKEQDNQFNLVFSISTVFTGIMCFVNGLIYDKLGTRFCRILAILCFIGAMLCLIFASPEVPMLLYPGTILLVYGGYLLLITNLQLANLMPHLRSTIMSLYAGSYDCSAVIFLIFKAAHEAGVRVNTCFIIQGCAFTILVSISTFCTLPKYHLPWPLPPGFRVKTPVSSICRKKSQVKKNNEAGPTEAGNEDNAEDPTKNVDANRNRSSPKKSPLMLNVDQRSASSKQTRPKSISQYLDVTHMKEGDISSQEFLLAINHVPRLSTASIHRSHLRRSAHKSSAVSLLRRAQKYSVNQHHMSMLNIPNQTQRSMLHRPSVSLDNVNRSPRMTTPGEDLLAINHVPRLSAATLSVHQSSPAISVFHSLASVSGVSNIMKPIEADDLQDADMGDNSVYEKRTTFRKEALSPLFMMEVMWMSFQRLRSWFFVGVFNPWITNMANGDRKTVSFYTSVFAAMQFFGIFTAPLNGRLMDRKPGKKYNYNNTKFERLHAAIPSFVLNCTVVLLLSIGAAIPVLEVQYVTFALHVLNRSFIYGPNSAFVANAFPFEYFGILLGTTLTVSAIFGMIQYPLFLLIQGPLEDDPTIVNITLIVLMTVTYAHPLYIWIYLKKKLKKQIHPNESAEPIKLNTDDCDENMDNRNVEVNNELNSLRNEVNNDMNNEVNNGLSANQEAVFPNANLADGYGSESETVEGATTPSYQESDEKTYL